MADVSWRDLQELNRPLHAEIRARQQKVTSVKVINAGELSEEAQQKLADWAPPGEDHFTLFLARSDNHMLDEVQAALDDEEKAQKLSETMKGRYRGRKEKPLSDAVAQIVAEPVFAVLRYGDMTLADNLFVPEDIGLAAMVFPYEGGRLSPGAFKLVQYVQKGKSAQLDALIVHREPRRSDAEKAVDGQVVIRPERWCETTGYVVATYTAGAAAAAWAAALAGPTPGAFDIADLGDDVVHALDQSPSVDELVQLRLDVLSD